MKNRVSFMFIGMLFCILSVFAQDVPAGLTNAFKRGSAQELVPYLGDKVEVIVSNKSQSYNRDGAKQAMNGFFTDNKVKGFSVNHQGKRDESSFIVGTLSTGQGNYRINCFIKKNGEQYLIHQIRIDKTNE